MLDNAHDELLSDAGGLPAGPCKRCEREVLAYPQPSGDGTPGYACAHCDTPLRRIYLVDESELETLGYAADDPLRQGCGTGCGAGGCGVRRNPS